MTRDMHGRRAQPIKVRWYPLDRGHLGRANVTSTWGSSSCDARGQECSTGPPLGCDCDHSIAAGLLGVEVCMESRRAWVPSQ